MKKTLLASTLLLACSLLFAGQVFAYPVDLYDEIKFQDSGVGNSAGGEFNILDTDGNYLFSTFCLEKNEYVDYSSTFQVVDISVTAYGGGKKIVAGDTGGDPLSAATKWLYWDFVTGDLEDLTPYTYSNAGIDALQNAIWYLEEEISSIAGLAGELVALAKEAAANNADTGDVAVMNITYLNDGGPAQSQLIATAPVPEPSTLMLLGGGGGLLWWMRRKKASK